MFIIFVLPTVRILYIPYFLLNKTVFKFLTDQIFDKDITINFYKIFLKLFILNLYIINAFNRWSFYEFWYNKKFYLIYL